MFLMERLYGLICCKDNNNFCVGNFFGVLEGNCVNVVYFYGLIVKLVLFLYKFCRNLRYFSRNIFGDDLESIFLK